MGKEEKRRNKGLVKEVGNAGEANVQRVNNKRELYQSGNIRFKARVKRGKEEGSGS